MKRLLMEFLGTFFLVLSVAMLANPIAIGCILMAWVYIGGYISGAHYNPMVSLAVALRGGLPWHKVPYYMVAQIIGGCAAFATVAYLNGTVTFPAPAAGVPLLKAFFVEVLLAFVLAFVILTVATSEKFLGNYVFGFAIGLTIPALAALGGHISGGLFNPAISIGASLFGLASGMHHIVWENLAMYVVGALLGGVLAAYAFEYFNGEDDNWCCCADCCKKCDA